jgi:hypothetical protein
LPTNDILILQSGIDAFLDVNLIVVLLHLLVQVSLFIFDDLLKLVLHIVYSLDDLVYLDNFLVDFFGVLTNLCSLHKHGLKKLFFYIFRIVFNYFYHNFLIIINLFVFSLIVIDDLIFKFGVELLQTV